MSEEGILYAIIIPKERTVKVERYENIDAAERAAGLEPMQVDFGTVGNGIGIVTYEFGLREPPEQHAFFAIGRSLYAGNAVLYSYDELGDTVDLNVSPLQIPFRWYKDVDEIEAAIAREEIVRPHVAVNNKLLWEWNVES
jgi:hypothetical protein